MSEYEVVYVWCLLKYFSCFYNPVIIFFCEFMVLSVVFFSVRAAPFLTESQHRVGVDNSLGYPSGCFTFEEDFY